MQQQAHPKFSMFFPLIGCVFLVSHIYSSALDVVPGTRQFPKKKQQDFIKIPNSLSQPDPELRNEFQVGIEKMHIFLFVKLPSLSLGCYYGYALLKFFV